MTTPVKVPVRNIPTDAGGNIRPNERVMIRHVPPSAVFYVDTQSEPIYTMVVKTDETGAWTADLPPNVTGTMYEVVESGSDRLTIAVPDPSVTPVPAQGYWWIADLLTVEPSNYPGVIDVTSLATVTALDAETTRAENAESALNTHIEQVAASIPGGAITGAPLFVYNQVSASSSWSIAHNLGFHPAVVVTDSAGNQVYGTVSYPDLNTCVVTFGAPFSGRADLI